MKTGDRDWVMLRKQTSRSQVLMTGPRGPEFYTTRATKFRMSESGKTQTLTCTVDDQPNLDLPSTEPNKTNSLHSNFFAFLE